jgi:hypothetical protein
VKWKAQLRRKREADDRKAKRDKELAMAAEAKRLEDMKSMAYRMGRREESAISTNTRIIRGTGGVRCCGVLAFSRVVSLRGVSAVNASGLVKYFAAVLLTTRRVFAGRIKRLELEDQEVRERIDRTEGKARRDRISKLMLEKQQEKHLSRSDRISKLMLEKQQEKHLSRSEVLSMTRALELKMKIEDKVEARNALRKDLVAKKKESMERTLYIEETLRDGEVHMTTPRSLVRRRIVRRMHIAMQRQHNNFMICEWGCGDWFRGTYLLCWSWFPNCFTYQCYNDLQWAKSR